MHRTQKRGIQQQQRDALINAELIERNRWARLHHRVDWRRVERHREFGRGRRRSTSHSALEIGQENKQVKLAATQLGVDAEHPPPR